VIGHVIDSEKVKLVKAPFEQLVIKLTYLRYRLQKSRYMKSEDQTVVIDGAEEYRAEPGSVRNAGGHLFRRR